MWNAFDHTSAQSKDLHRAKNKNKPTFVGKTFWTWVYTTVSKSRSCTYALVYDIKEQGFW